MSNITRLKIKIKQYSPVILENALRLIEQHYGLRAIMPFSNEYFIKGEGLPYGMRIRIHEDELEIIGDSQQPLFNEIASQINQYYVAAQNVIALRAMGYVVKVEKQKEKLVVLAMR